MVAILHNIRSLHNVGAIFRTADGAGVKKLYLAGITPAPLDRFGKVRPDFLKVALGAERTVAWEKVRSATRLVKKLRKEGYSVFASEQSSRSVPYYMVRRARHARAAHKERVALVLGSEVKGLPSAILTLADKILEIPMYGKKESLNVAVAFGIVAYHFACPPKIYRRWVCPSKHARQRAG